MMTDGPASEEVDAGPEVLMYDYGMKTTPLT